MATILVVDDEPVNRYLLAAVLKPHGHAVREAADGEEALAAIAAGGVDLAVVDLAMPRVSGTALLRTLRRERHDDTRVVLYTATPPDGAMQDFADTYGVNGFLVKPVEPSEVLRVIGEALAGPRPALR
jgi:CheY-like chemotaxis protein